MATAHAEWGDDVRVLARALDQAADVLDQVRAEDLSRPTPCADWDLGALADHLVAAPGRFLAAMRGERPDWSAPPVHVVEEWGPTFRPHADDLVHAWHEHDGEVSLPADFQTAELATHTWDLATAIGYPVERLDEEVAERALGFLRANLAEDQRGGAFAAEQTAAAGAGPYEQLAAFTGRAG